MMSGFKGLTFFVKTSRLQKRRLNCRKSPSVKIFIKEPRSVRRCSFIEEVFMLTLGLVRSLPRGLSRVATEMTLNFYKYNIEEKK